MTFENILDDMLSRVDNDIDKREGSIIYDALAPAAYKLAETYFKLSNYTDLFFIDTTVGEYLDRKALDYGVTRKEARKAIRKIETNSEIEIGSRWGIEDLIYTVTEAISTNIYKAECNQAGELGNLYEGKLENIDNISGINATLTNIITSGSNVESDEDLRARIKEQFINPAQDGNAAQYLKWATEYSGIGAAKVFPLWNGANTVKVAITNSLFKPAESGLVEEFQKYMDPDSKGLGNGVAPIGSKVKVTGGTKKDINITANVTLNEGYTEVIGASEAISNYLSKIVYKKNSVSYMRIGSTLLDSPSILDLSNLKINGLTSDVIIEGDQIPVLNSINLTVVQQ
ncbi:MAG: baseplate J/gp47 family protein [Clostridium sp.]|nr:baseplate J/gp47 family protein [Clostridium sp.]